MLTLTLPPDITSRIEVALSRAGRREIGGVLLAEHVAENGFVVRDLSIQGGGTLASFVRRVEQALTQITFFFEQTRRNYRRYNYIGEWHSHPSFEPSPSSTDHESMQSIVSDPETGARFLVLLIVRLREGVLVGTVHTYLPDGSRGVSSLDIRRS